MFCRLRISLPVICALLASSVLAAPAPAQVQNPIQVFKDAYKKAKEQQQQQAKPQTPAPAQPSTQPPAQPGAQASPAARTAEAQNAAAPWTPPTEDSPAQV